VSIVSAISCTTGGSSPGKGRRRHRIDRHAVALELHGRDDGEPRDARLGRTVVRLPGLPNSPEREVVLMTRASTFIRAFDWLRQYSAVCRVGENVPFGWTEMTASHPDSDIDVSMRSRKIPALLTNTSSLPKISTAGRRAPCHRPRY
jgi:hypothetical protein